MKLGQVRDGVDRRRHLPTEQIVDIRAGALVRDVHHIDADLAGTVLEGEWLSDMVLRLVGDEAGDQVPGAARREADQDVNRLIERGLRGNDWPQRKQKRGGKRGW